MFRMSKQIMEIKDFQRESSWKKMEVDVVDYIFCVRKFRKFQNAETNNGNQ